MWAYSIQYEEYEKYGMVWFEEVWYGWYGLKRKECSGTAKQLSLVRKGVFNANEAKQLSLVRIGVFNANEAVLTQKQTKI